MLHPNPVNWFEIPVSNMKRAIAFYERAFAVKLTPEEVGGLKFAFFPHERGVPGAGGSLIHSPPVTPSHNGTTVYFSVPSVDEALAQIANAGGKTLIPKKDIGQYGFFAQFEDSEGNRVALHEAPKM
jgi:predicted enzyme related to lactoylglutathione lyase